MSFDTGLFLALFVILLGLEWRFRRRGLRVGAILLALAVLAFYQPNYTVARRRALGTPPAKRVTQIPFHGERVSEYESGVYTTMEAVSDAAGFGSGARLVAAGALVWLACSPALGSARDPSNEPASPSMADAAVSGAEEKPL